MVGAESHARHSLYLLYGTVLTSVWRYGGTVATEYTAHNHDGPVRNIPPGGRAAQSRLLTD
jgi:hypothetical protein